MHILSHDQNQIANHFSKPSQDKSAYRYDGGDHIIMVREVMNFEHSDITPLVYQRGNYAIATGKELADEVEALINASASSNRGDASSLSHLLGTAYFQMYPPSCAHSAPSAA